MHDLIVLLLLAAPSADGPRYLYSCRSYTGAVTVQDMPCPPTARETRRVPVAGDVPTRAAEESRQRVIDQAKALNDAGVYGRTANPSQRKPWDPPAGENWTCESVKRARDRSLNAIGLSRTYEILSSWQKAVYDACK